MHDLFRQPVVESPKSSTDVLKTAAFGAEAAFSDVPCSLEPLAIDGIKSYGA